MTRPPRKLTQPANAAQAAFLAAEDRAWNERMAQAEATIAKAKLTPTMKRALASAYCSELKPKAGTAKALVQRGLATHNRYKRGWLTLTFAGRIAHERAAKESLERAAKIARGEA